MPPNQQNQYDFILSTNHQQKPGLNFGGGWKGRGILIAIGLVLLIIIFMVTSSILGGSSKAQNQRLVDILKAQNEIVRISAIGNDKGREANTRNFAINTQLSVSSSQQQVRAALAKRGVSEKQISKLIADSKNAKSDATLDEGTKNNRFDETFTTLMTKQLSDYQKLLKTAANNSTGKNEKTTLTNSGDSAARLTTKPTASTTQTPSNTENTDTTPDETSSDDDGEIIDDSSNLD